MHMEDYSHFHYFTEESKMLHDADLMVEKTLNSYQSYPVTLRVDSNEANNIETRVILHQKWDANGLGYKIIGRDEEIERGYWFEWDNHKWIIDTKPEYNRVFRKATVSLCNEMFELREPDVTITDGKDEFNRPKKKVIQKGSVTYVPCYTDMNNASVAIADSNKPINILGNIVTITLPYRESASIDYGQIFKLYGLEYKIIRIDPTQSINKVGILKITGELVGDPSKNKGEII